MRPKSLKIMFLSKMTMQCGIVYLAFAGITGCKKSNPSDVILPGRHLSESQASSLAIAALPTLPQARGFTAKFKDGFWDISSIHVTMAEDHKSASVGTNTLVLAAKVRDVDGKVEMLTNE